MSGEKKKFNKAEYNKEWNNRNSKLFHFKFRNNEDDIIIDKLKEVKSKSVYIKSLVLKDLEENK